MDEETRRSLLSSVDAFGNPKWEPVTPEDLPEELVEEVPGYEPGDLERLDAGDDIFSTEPDPEWIPEVTDSPAEEEGPSRRKRILAIAVVLGIFLLALVVRLYFFYFITDPNELVPSWSNDTWHRWQIAFLSKEIGFSKGFLRLWDLKGMEYYWGVLPPLVLAFLFTVTKSVDVMILRWLTLIAGVLNVVFLYLIGRRFWNAKVGFAAAAFAAFNPILIFNDPSGMVEPISFVFLLAGIYFFPRRSVLAGVLLALGAMTRAEAWLLSAGLLIAALLSEEDSQSRISLSIGWGIPILIYMKYLLDKTGNPIYPIYWNFLANAAGEWQFREAYTSYQLAARPILGAIFAIMVVATIWTFIKKPRAYLLKLLGFSTTAFVTGFIGLTAYLGSYEPWFWMTRFFVFPYTFLGYILIEFMLGWMSLKYAGWRKFGLGWAATLFVLLVLQLTWLPVLFDVGEGYTSTTSVAKLAEQGRYVGELYQGGVVLMPEGNPQFTYALGRYSGIPGDKLLSQMYGPIYYYQDGDPFEHWDEVEPQMWDWLQAEGVKLMITNAGDERFTPMIEAHPERLVHIGRVPEKSMDIYQVVSW